MNRKEPRNLEELLQPLVDDAAARQGSERHIPVPRVWRIAIDAEALDDVEEKHLQSCSLCRIMVARARARVLQVRREETRREEARRDEFGAECNECYAMLRGMLHKRFGPRLGEHEIEDIIQETFQRAFRDRERLDRSVARVSTWLIAIAARVGAEYLRRRRYRELDPAAVKLDMARQARMLEVLSEFSESEREVLFLYFSRGMPLAEIAREHGITPRTIQVRKARLLDALDALGERHFGDETKKSRSSGSTT